MLVIFSIPANVLALPIPPEIKKIVTFIFIKNNKNEFIPNGTGFFVCVETNREKSDTCITYLVTAKHVLQQQDGKSFFSEVFIRLNKKGGTVEMLPLKLITDGEKKNIFFHEDSTVDLAVINALPNPQLYDFKILPDNFITTKEDFQKLNIREGSEVFFSGLFIRHMGEQKNYPIVRFGKVALVTDEKIDWNGDKVELYLIEATTYGGNSGSPVFFYAGIEREPGKLIFSKSGALLKLAGVMKGFFNESGTIQFIETSKIPVASLNSGIAGVIPSYKLYEILFSDELMRQRNNPIIVGITPP
jgi:hypothetical protein